MQHSFESYRSHTRSHTRKIYAVLVAFLVVTCAGLGVETAHAGSYTVNANVPYGSPTQPASIQSPADNATVNEALMQISGTCQQLNPTAIVSIWRNGQTIGSAVCNGNFSLTAMLVPGPNVLTARTSNIDGSYGPDSLRLTVTLVLVDSLPVTSAPNLAAGNTVTGNPAVGGTAEPATPQEKSRSTNAAAKSGLLLKPLNPYIILNIDNKADVTFTVSGGSLPYTIGLKWGDGRAESHVLREAGTYSYRASYSKSGTYLMQVWVRDTAGGFAESNYAILSRLPARKVVVAAATPTQADSGLRELLAVASVVAVASGLAAAAALVGFRLGIHNSQHPAVRLIRRSIATSSSRLPKPAWRVPKGQPSANKARGEK